MVETVDVMNVVFDAIDEVNQMLAVDERIVKSRDTSLSYLQSNTIVYLIVAIEKKIEEKLAIEITLGDQVELYSQEDSPLENVQTLTDFISKVVELEKK